ncbi:MULTISPECIES: hypothetical protein [unclassified Streptomyces]|uniref:hypothetical protein n=1 Tax=unclassified Streptomyces TaxID=2593676 RepID=UPI0030777D89
MQRGMRGAQRQVDADLDRLSDREFRQRVVAAGHGHGRPGVVVAYGSDLVAVHLPAVGGRG